MVCVGARFEQVLATQILWPDNSSSDEPKWKLELGSSRHDTHTRHSETNPTRTQTILHEYAERGERSGINISTTTTETRRVAHDGHWAARSLSLRNVMYMHMYMYM